MQYVELGTTALRVSRVIHGCMGFGGDDKSAIRAIHAAYDAGVTSFDTAPVYGFGKSETLLGQAVRDRRDRVQILTKVGLRWDSSHGRVMFQSRTEHGTPIIVRKDSRARSVREEVEGSLQRLGVDAIWLLQVHHRDLDTPIAETMGALADLQREGKIRAIGVSNYSLPELELAAESLSPLPLASAQLEYNLLKRELDLHVLPWARRNGVSVLAYSPLAKGVLAGKQIGRWRLPDDWRRHTPYFHRKNLALAQRALQVAVGPIAAGHGVLPSQVCLAWLLAQPGLSAAIVGASSPGQALSNARAAELSLTPEELARLGSAFRGFDATPPPPSIWAARWQRVVSKVSRRLRSA
jgi:aryl-alcohol dehydrogenase-like predicted oxidoreductase